MPNTAMLGGLMTILCWGAGACAQCEPAWHSAGLTMGFDGRVVCSTIWDPDGAGPNPPDLIVGGDFMFVGDLSATHIAAWDGVKWRALGAGLTDTVVNLAVYSGEPVAIEGSTSSSAPRRIMRFRGGQWEPLWTGSPQYFQSLVVFDGRLMTCAAPAWNGPGYVWAWDGQTWQQLGGTFSPAPVALAAHQGSLYAGGWFTSPGQGSSLCIARWDGAAWTDVGTPITPRDQIASMTEFGGELVVGCYTGLTSPDSHAVQAWNGSSWRLVGTGLLSNNLHLSVQTLGSYRGTLLAGGDFHINGGGGYYPTAGLTSNAWGAWPSNINTPRGPEMFTEFGDELIVGGGFNFVGERVLNSLAAWNGLEWRPLVRGNMVQGRSWCTGAATLGGELIISGTLSMDIDGVLTQGVAAWDGTRWRALGMGLIAEDETYPLVLLADGAGLVAAGRCWIAETSAFCNAARWDGSSWTPLPFGPVLYVNAITRYAGRIVVVGESVAQFDGSAWSPLGDGTHGGYAVCVYNGELVSGGALTTTAGTYSTSITAWNGTSWRSLGNGVDHYVFALADYRGALLAAGRSPDGSIALSRWDGTSWTTWPGTGTGSSSPGTASALWAEGNDLYVGGSFSSIAGVSANGIARWDGASWHALGEGLQMNWYHQPGVCLNLLPFRGAIAAVGAFSSAGGMSAPVVALWGRRPASCYSDCDCSGGELTALDFVCFMNRFAAGDAYANCDGSTVAPALNVNDFQCFLNSYAAGCS